MNKGILDKSVSDVIRSEPKDVETLYARLEKQLNMPIAQIKQIFKDVPLDKLIAKELKEYIIKIKKSWLPHGYPVGYMQDENLQDWCCVADVWLCGGGGW